MTYATYPIGITGKLGSGKDTVLERMQILYPDRFHRFSFAAKLKQATAALLDVSVEMLEEWKRDNSVGVQLVDEHRGGLDSPMTIRTVLQRMGTEVGRDLFGKNFWVDQAMWQVDEMPPLLRNCQAVFTDVRFDNEAEAIDGRGGDIWSVHGSDEDTGSHSSEAGISEELIAAEIDNTIRDDNYASLDAQIKAILG